MRVAAKLLELAVALARGHQQRVPLVPDLGRSLEEIGELRRAERFLDEVDSRSGAASTRLAFLELASLRDYTEASPDSFKKLEAAPASVRDSVPEVEARALILEAEVSWTKGKYDDMKRPLDKAAGEAKGVQDHESRQSLLNSIFGWEARAILLGSKEARTGLDRCDEILRDRRVSGSRSLKAVVLAVKAGLHAMLGEFDEARQDYRESQRMGEAFGLDAWLAALPLYSGPVELLDEQAAEAGRQLRRGYDALERMGDTSRRATTAAFLAQALYEQQRSDEAMKFARTSKELAAEADVFTQVVWRGALAKLLARGGDCEGAVPLAREAVALANKTGGLNLQGDALLDLAVVMGACGRRNAQTKAGDARALYEKKGNVVGVRRADEFITRLRS